MLLTFALIGSSSAGARQGLAAHQKKEEILRIKTEIDKARAVLQNYKVELRELDRDDLAVYQVLHDLYGQICS